MIFLCLFLSFFSSYAQDLSREEYLRQFMSQKKQQEEKVQAEVRPLKQQNVTPQNAEAGFFSSEYFTAFQNDPSYQAFLKNVTLPQNAKEWQDFRRTLVYWKIKNSSYYADYLKDQKTPPPLPAEEQVQEKIQEGRVKTERELFLEQYKAQKEEQEEALKQEEVAEAIVVTEQAPSDDDLEKDLDNYVKESQDMLKQLTGTTGSQEEQVGLWANPDIVVRNATKVFREMMTEADVYQMLEEKVKSSPFSFVLPYGSFLIEFATKLLRSPDALPRLMGVIKDRSRLLIYVLCNLGTIVLGFFLKRLMKTQESASVALKRFFGRIIILYAIRIGLFVYFFSYEASPAWNIFLDVIFKKGT